MTDADKHKRGRPRKDGLEIGSAVAEERDSKLAVKGKRYVEALSRSSYRMFAPVDVGGGEITSSYVHITRGEYERRSRIVQGSSVGEEGEGVDQQFTPYPKQVLFLSSNHDEILFGGARGGGKDLHLDTLVLTNSGWKRAGDIAKADLLVAPDGSYTGIVGIYPKHDRDMYRVEFIDGRDVICDAEHSWQVYGKSHGHRDGWRVKQTKDLLRLPSDWSVPLTAAVPGERWRDIDPYIVGYILGNGTLTSDKEIIYTVDREVIAYLTQRGWRAHDYKYMHSVMLNPVYPEAHSYQDLLGRVSGKDKMVPECLLMADAETRLLLLQGLMDSDGHCDKEGRASFCNRSLNLCEAVQYLTRSLGGKAVIHNVERGAKEVGGYMTDGQYYKVSVSYVGKFEPFMIERKRRRLRMMQKEDKLGIKSIERVANADGVCFAVAHPSKLFVIKDFIVTHNSQALAQDAALHVRRWHWEGHELVVDKQSIDYPEYVALILRRKYTDIYMNFKPMCDRIYESLGAIWGEKAQCYTFPSGAKIYLKHCDEAKDVDKYIGGNYHYLGVEEANQFPERWIREIGGSVRSTNPDLKPFKRYTTNPGGVGHIWLKRRFIDVCPPVEGKLCWNEVHDLEYTELNPGEPYRDEQGNFRWFIPSLVFDNPALINGDLQYVRFLKSLDPLKKKMWLHGKWDEMSGLFFHMWSKEYHVVDEREVVVDPENCRIYRCVDYGTTNPFACLFAQVDRSGMVTVFDEIYETGLTPSMQAEMILARTRQWRLTEDDIDLTVVDPAMKTGNQDMGIRLGSVLEIYQDCGVQHIALGNNARVQGWGVMKDYLRIPDMGEDGVQAEPMLRFSSRCTNAIETIPILTSDINNVEDVDTDGEDHIADSLRYLLMFIHTPFPTKVADTTPKWLQELRKKSKGEGGTITDAWTA